MARCKVCSSHLVDQINEKIMANISFMDISEWCKSEGFDCSHMSIKRHADNDHVKKPVVVSDDDSQPVQSISQVAILQDENELSNFKNCTSSKLKKIAILQLRVVEQKQIEYIQGISRFPQVEIQALKNIIEMCKSLDLVANTEIDDRPKGLSTDTIQQIRDKIFGL
jgi:ferritin